MANLLEEFLDGVVPIGTMDDGTEVSMVFFDRELSEHELEAVIELMAVGDGVA